MTLIKVAIIVFQIIPLAAGVLTLGLGALWLQVQDEKKAPADGDASDRGESETHFHYSKGGVN